MSTATTPATRRPRPGRAVLATEARLFLREPGTLFWTIAFPAVLLTVLGLIPTFRSAEEGIGGRRVIDLYVPVVVLVAVVMSALQALPPVMTAYRERGVLRRISATPARAWHVLGAQVVLHVAASLAAAVLAVVVGRLAFDVALPRTPWLWFLGLLGAIVVTMSIGAAVAAVSPTTKVATAVGSAVFIPMLGSTGVWYPVQAMSGWLETVFEALPLGAAVQIMDAASVGDWPSPVHALVVLAWTVVAAVVAVRFFRWE